MPSWKTLTLIMKDKSLLKAFEVFLRGKKLDRAWEFARLHRDEKTAYRIFVANMTSKEIAFAPQVKKYGDNTVRSLSKPVQDRFAQTSGNWDQFTIIEKQQMVEEQLYAHDAWKKFLSQSKELMLNNFTALAEGEFKNSNEYKKVIHQGTDAKRLALELGLEGEDDKILGLAVAIGTGDTGTQNRLSKALGSKQKPKKGKVMKAKQLIAYIGKKIRNPFR